MYKNKPCLHCQRNTRNLKFCSSSCATTYNNIHGKTGRTRVVYTCKECGNRLPYRRRVCDNCLFLITTKDGKRVSPTEITKNEISTNDTQKYRRIRANARKIAKTKGLLKRCIVCGYDKYVECCHRTPISHFSGDTLVSIINSPDNLFGLCPNHHWEFDHHILNIGDSTGIQTQN